MNWFINIGIFLGIFILVGICAYVYFYVSAMIFMQKKLKRENGLILPTNKYIYFKHKGTEGIGVIYNTNEDDKDFPEYYVACVYDDKSIQHLKLSEIDNYKFIDKNDK